MLSRRRGFTLVEIMIVVAIIGILVAIAMTGFVQARDRSRRGACQESQAKIDGAKQQWALDNNQPSTAAAPTWAQLVGATLYIRKTPVCPSSGTYTINALSVEPACSLSAVGAQPHTFL